MSPLIENIGMTKESLKFASKASLWSFYQILCNFKNLIFNIIKNNILSLIKRPFIFIIGKNDEIVFCFSLFM